MTTGPMEDIWQQWRAAAAAEISNDVLTTDQAVALATVCREDILTGKEVHPICIERLCCYIMKGKT